jgi:hypothetical protein
VSQKEKGKPRTASFFFRLVIVAVMGACSTEHLPNPSAPIQIVPNSETIALRGHGGKAILDLTIRLENTSRHAILWSECALAVERSQYIMAMDRRSEEWLEVWRPGCADDSDAQKILRPGETANVPLEITAAAGGDFRGDVGIYRVRFFLSSDIGGEYHQLDPGLSVSRPFSVVAPES